MAVTGNDVNKRGNLRAWIQGGGALASNPLQYAGQDSTYLAISGVSRQYRGGLDPSQQWDPLDQDRYIIDAVISSPPDLDSISVQYKEKKGGIPFSHIDQYCPITFYELVGECKSLSDFLAGWTQYTRIYPGTLALDADDGDRTPFSEDDVLMTTINYKLPRKIYDITALTFATQSLGTLTGTTINDITYGPVVKCANCGTPDDGTKTMYAVATGGAAAKPILYYKVPGVSTWANISVAVAANAEVLNAVRVVRGKLVMLSPTATSGTSGGYYVSDIDPNTGVPGTPVKVTTGFVNNKQPRDMVVVGTTLWISADGGYIYKCVSNPLNGVEVSTAGGTTTSNLTRIRGNDEVIVAVGAANAIIYSDNNGAVWAAPTNVVTGTLTAIGVISRNVWWVGTSAGVLQSTDDGGRTAWDTTTLPGTLASIQDIAVATPEVIYIAAATAAPVAMIYTTWNGGVDWTNTSPRITALPTFSEATRIAIPLSAGPSAIANNIAIAGKAAVATDGTALLGVGAVK